jgi:hypothetical protein
MNNKRILRNHIEDFLIQNPISNFNTISEVCFEHSISDATLWRTLSQMDNILKIGKGKNTHYSMIQFINDDLYQTILQTDIHGEQKAVAKLYSLIDGQFFVEPLSDKDNSWLILGSNKKLPGLFPKLPWYLNTFYPHGFLGRMWAKEYSKQNPTLENLNNWQDWDVIHANKDLNIDISGNLTLHSVYRDYYSIPIIHIEDRLTIYDSITDKLAKGEMVGSSVDGEQPKFAVNIMDDLGQTYSALIKMTTHLKDLKSKDYAKRQADLLIMEHVSGKILRHHGWDAPDTEILKSDDFIYLESKRFDRTEKGKKGFVSLKSLVEALNYKGPKGSWTEALKHLESLKLISNETLMKGFHLALIGNQIDNTDMHLGNLSLWLPDDKNELFSLAPVYDMTSMRWSVSLNQNVNSLILPHSIPDVSVNILNIAEEIWQTVSDHPYISDEWATFSKKRVIQIQEKIKTMNTHVLISNNDIVSKKSKHKLKPI